MTIRTPEGERVLDQGEVVCFPAGPEGAHQVRSANDEPARVAIVSTKNEFGISNTPTTAKWESGRERRTSCSTARPSSSLGRLPVVRAAA